MAKVWTRIVMAMIFVFATMSSPLHARSMHTDMTSADAAQSAPMSMTGMSAECAKAMAAAHKSLPSKKAPDHSGGCCANGCNCPLSHCPATPPVLGSAVLAFMPVASSVRIDQPVTMPASSLSDRLKRPPKA